jgi:hypothetical protein
LRMPMVTCPGTPDAGDPHVRCDEGGADGGNAGSPLLYR